MEQILIEGLELFAYHGVRESERKNGQVFLLDIELKSDMFAACESDNLDDTVNYSRVIDCAAAAFCAQPYSLIERAAKVTADAIMRECKGVEEITLRVHKPGAPVKHVVADIIFVLKQTGRIKT
jgi:dihydroneopterin aldolase